MIKTHSDFLQVAFKAYDNPKIISVADFEADLKRFGYMNTAASRYFEDNDDKRLRVLVNHIVIIGNCFGIQTGVDLIRYKTYECNVCIIETILYFLKMISESDHLSFTLLNKLESL